MSEIGGHWAGGGRALRGGGGNAIIMDMFSHHQPFKQRKPGIRWKPELGLQAQTLRGRGLTLKQVGEALGVSTERARQILLHHGRIERGKCHHCNPQHFWVGDIYFGTYATLYSLDRYEREGHEPIEIMQDICFERKHQWDKNRHRWIKRSA